MTVFSEIGAGCALFFLLLSEISATSFQGFLCGIFGIG